MLNKAGKEGRRIDAVHQLPMASRREAGWQRRMASDAACCCCCCCCTLQSLAYTAIFEMFTGPPFLHLVAAGQRISCQWQVKQEAGRSRRMASEAVLLLPWLCHTRGPSFNLCTQDQQRTQDPRFKDPQLYVGPRILTSQPQNGIGGRPTPPLLVPHP